MQVGTVRHYESSVRGFHLESGGDSVLPYSYGLNRRDVRSAPEEGVGETRHDLAIFGKAERADGRRGCGWGCQTLAISQGREWRRDTMDEPISNRRLRALMEVWSGRRTAKDAAVSLGISRKSYYQWENRAIAAMHAALQDGQPGRPRKGADVTRLALEKETRDLRAEVLILQQRESIRSRLGGTMSREARRQAVTSVLEIVERLHEQTGQSVTKLISKLGLARSSFARWHAAQVPTASPLESHPAPPVPKEPPHDA